MDRGSGTRLRGVSVARALGRPSALVEGCGSLRDSIDAAVDSRAARGDAALMRDFYQVPVAEVVRETDDACSLVLDVPPSLAAAFAYRPGQFVTVRVPSDRTGSVARCYSLSSSPHAGDRPAITVKRTAGGYASNWLHDNITAGSVLDLLPPAGTFVPLSWTPTSCCSRPAAGSPR